MILNPNLTFDQTQSKNTLDYDYVEENNQMLDLTGYKYVTNIKAGTDYSENVDPGIYIVLSEGSTGVTIHVEGEDKSKFRISGEMVVKFKVNIRSKLTAYSEDVLLWRKIE